MVAESALLGLPLLVMAYMVNRYFPLAGMRPGQSGYHAGHASIQDRLIMDIGAGVYEEFVFRFADLHVYQPLLHDLLKLAEARVNLVMVVVSGFLFALYHYWSPTEHFTVRVFAFRTVAGIYFGIIFMFRGFGITAGSHCAYDIIITLC